MKVQETECYDFGLRLKKLRVEKGFTQQQLAERLGITKGTVYKYESNTLVPPLEKLIVIALTLNTSLDYLAGLSNYPSIRLDGLDPNQIKWLIYGINMLKAENLTTLT